MKWSPQQEQARIAVARWMRDPRAQVFYLAGYAGTGKSTLAKDLVDGSGKRWLFGAFTGKAAHVLRQKGCEGAATIHSLIYKQAGEETAETVRRLRERLDGDSLSAAGRVEIVQRIAALQKLRGGPRFVLATSTSKLADPDIAGIVVDEVSMVDERLGRDLESFGKKILVLGDPAQLPPVGGGGYFTARTPNVTLTEVHRHARESGVLRLATHVRGGGTLASFASAPDAQVIPRRTAARGALAEQALASDQVLVGRNRTRHALNRRIRELRGRDGMPRDGDRLVCLRNDREAGLFNGSQWAVEAANCRDAGDVGEFTLRSEDDDRVFDGEAWLHYFQGRGEELVAMGKRRRDHAEFDFGDALTCHKAQGSQWDRVFVIDESDLRGTDPRRWLYTAITRAAKHVAVLV